MRLHVPLQIARSSASVGALVTFERLFSDVLPHVIFQVFSSNARILAYFASVWLFTRVRHLVSLQMACFCCFVFTLIAMVYVFPGVLLDMPLEGGMITA